MRLRQWILYAVLGGWASIPVDLVLPPVVGFSGWLVRIAIKIPIFVAAYFLISRRRWLA